jgi:hypothetical protein
VSLHREGFRNRTVTQDLHFVVRRDEAGSYQRVDRHLRQVFLGCEFFERRKVDRLEFHSLQIGEAELRQATLQRHLTAFET